MDIIFSHKQNKWIPRPEDMDEFEFMVFVENGRGKTIGNDILPPPEAKEAMKDTLAPVIPGKTSATELSFMNQPPPGQAGALPEGHVDPPQKTIGTKALDSFLPATSALSDGARETMEKAGLPESAKLASAIAGLAGGAIDGASYIFSPTKLLGNAATALKAGTTQAVNATTKASSSILSAFGKAFAQNAADATILNNAQRALEGEDLSVGAPELLGGLAGGAVKGKGDLRRGMDINRARIYAGGKNANQNFAKRYTGLKDPDAAVEQVMKSNLKKNETFENAVDRLRREYDATENEFYSKFDKIKDYKYNKTPIEIMRDLDNYAIDHSLYLGGSWSEVIAQEVKDSYIDLLESVMANRLKAQGMSPRIALNNARELSREPDRLLEAVEHLTLGELDYIKRGMQKRTSAYNRGQGTQERMGKESVANKEGSEGILSNFTDYIEKNSNLTDEQKINIIKSFDSSIMDAMDNIDENFYRAMEANKVLTGEQLKEYMDLNKRRSNLIGIKAIMNDANKRYERLHINNNNAFSALSRANSRYTDTQGAMARGATSRFLDFGRPEYNEAPQDNTRTKLSESAR